MQKQVNPFHPKKISSILVEKKIIPEKSANYYLKHYSEALKNIKNKSETHSIADNTTIPIDILVSFGFIANNGTGKKIDEDLIYQILAEEWGFDFKKIDPLKLDVGIVTKTIPKNIAKRHLILPLERTDGKLIVATPDPFNVEAFDDIARIISDKVQVVVSSKGDIINIIKESFGFQKSIAEAEIQFSESQVDLGNLEQYVKLKSTTDLPSNDQHIINAVNHIISYAFEQRASDIHIEPKREKTIVRLRIDGSLYPVYKLPKKVHNAIVSRIKAMSRLDMAEKRRPQDGRIKTVKNNIEVEIRISTLPVAFGEKVVLRLMDPQILFQDLNSLGLEGRDLKLVNNFIKHPNGIILVCGPTGSGKSTTLYSALKQVSSPEINITTIEDPIEMVHEDFNQIAVNPSIDITFAKALRHILRQDPDVIMLGEMRDIETAKNAVQASLTGHLVLSTLHTNDSPSSIIRLLDIGLEPFLVKSTLIGIISQRLIKKICEDCKYSYKAHHRDLESRGINTGLKGEITLYKGKGCSKCRGTGFYGRTAIYEIMPFSENISKLVKHDSSVSMIKKSASDEGMTMLHESAISKMVQGLTTESEVAKFIDIQ